MLLSNKSFLMMALSTMLISSIMAMSSTNWIFMWMSMEINMLSFIPLMINLNQNQETEASIKYFMAQAIGSSIMLMTSMSQWSMNSIHQMNILLISSIMLKLGMAPFHFWFPSVMMSLPWMTCMLLATWQKLAPLTILAFLLCSTSPLFILFTAGLNALLGGMMGMNQTHLRSIMAYSSITHMGWMTSMLYISKPMMTMSYYIMYCMITIPLFMMFYSSNQSSNKQFNKLNSLTPTMQLTIPIMLLSLSGMPPLTGFIPKWLTINLMCQLSPMTLIILITGAMMNMFFYMNITFNSLLSMNITKLNYSLKNMTPKPLTMMATMVLLLMPLIML